MDASLRWRSVQHDKPVQSFQAFLLCHSERSEESSMDASLRWRSVQHDTHLHFNRQHHLIAH